MTRERIIKKFDGKEIYSNTYAAKNEITPQTTSTDDYITTDGSGISLYGSKTKRSQCIDKLPTIFEVEFQSINK